MSVEQLPEQVIDHKLLKFESIEIVREYGDNISLYQQKRHRFLEKVFDICRGTPLGGGMY